MSRKKRWATSARRSVWDVRQRIWRDVKLWLAVTLLVALLSAWRGLPWASFTALTVVALAVVLVGVFFVQFVGNLRHPDQHPDWLAEPPRVLGSNIMVAIKSKLGTPYLESHACDVQHPDGTTRRAYSDEPGNGFRFYFWYPQDFGSAHAAVNGRYEISWFLGASGEKLRPVLSHLEDISIE
jgi:hypothetical protein